MRTIEVKIPEPVFRQAQDLAALENISLEQMISLAVTQTIGIWSTERHSDKDLKRVGRQRFLDLLQEALDSNRKNLERLR